MNDETCEWHEDINGTWWTTCDQGFEFDQDGPIDNGFVYCPFCGQKIVEKSHFDDEEY